MRVSLADLIASETHGVSYKTLKYSLDAPDLHTTITNNNIL